MERVAPETGRGATGPPAAAFVPQEHDAELVGRGGAAASLIRNKRRVLDLFRERVQQQLPHADNESAPMIIDTLPVFLTRLGIALIPGDELEFASQYSNVAHQHGNERALLTNYSLEDVIREYQILREVLTEVLRADDGPTAQDWVVIHRSIDEAVAASASAFVKVQTNFRDQFSAALAHDFRAPLSNALNYLELLRCDADSARREHFVTRARLNLQQLQRMISEQLDVARAQANLGLPMRFESCEAGELARNLLEDLRSTYGERFVLSVSQPVHGWCDCERLRRALGNLIENAVKYGRDDSQITIGVAELQGRLMLSVHNYGEPIPPEALPHLFVAFQRRAADKTAKPGWGLGLMHVQAIAQAHGGSVTVESSDERGTTFTIDILVDPREWLASRKSRR